MIDSTVPRSLTAVVTAHSERHLLRITLKSVTAALDLMGTEGVDTELVIVLDNADPMTRAEAERWCGRATLRLGARTIYAAVGKSGAARNAGIETAQGEAVALVDGDDLVSENYFRSALSVLKNAPRADHRAPRNGCEFWLPSGVLAVCAIHRFRGELSRSRRIQPLAFFFSRPAHIAAQSAIRASAS